MSCFDPSDLKVRRTLVKMIVPLCIFASFSWSPPALATPSPQKPESRSRSISLGFESFPPPSGWVELKPIEPVRLLWIQQVVAKSATESSLFTIQVHNSQDPKIRQLKIQLENWKTTKEAPDLSPLKVAADSLEEFELPRPSSKSASGLTCLSFRATGPAANGKDYSWLQTWCFTQGDKTIAAVERGTDRISAIQRYQLIEQQANLLIRPRDLKGNEERATQ